MREKEKSTRVVFVRHGITDFPSDRIYCDGVEDPSLNEEGLGQATQAADFLASVKAEAIISSPAKRTRMTAEAISTRLGLDVSCDPRLVERRFGIWEGMFFDEIEKQYPDQYKEWKCNQAEFKPENGESVFDLAERVNLSISELKQRFTGKTVIVVCHVGPIRVMLAEALGLPLTSYRRLRVDPASVSCVDYGRSQNNLIVLNYHFRHAL